MLFLVSIFLIDHAWTYKVQDARKNLENFPGLVERMAKLMDVEFDPESYNKQTIIEEVLNNMWKFNNCYSIGLYITNYVV